MSLDEQVRKEIISRVNELSFLQQPNGSWKFCFEGSLMTDALMIMTIKSLRIKGEKQLIEKLVQKICNLQSYNGAWKAYPDESYGNLSATVQAYTALLISGEVAKDNPSLLKAEKFIRQNGGLKKCHFMTKWILAVFGLYPWPNLFYIPMTILLLPPSSPFHFFQFSSYARIHFIPMLIAANKKFVIDINKEINLDHLIMRADGQNIEEWEFRNAYRNQPNFWQELYFFIKQPQSFHQAGYKYAERYMLDRIENDGTLYSYASATFFMIYALLALGYKKESPIINQAYKGLKQLISEYCNGIHLENSTSIIWDTALISYALQETEHNPYTKVIQESTNYLLSKQHNKIGDWQINHYFNQPGGWGFSHNNSIHPDQDDTAAALRALTRRAATNITFFNGWQKGTNYLLSMQNSDGGWAAFERNKDLKLLTYLPLENAKDAAIDPSTADLTGRVLEYLGNFTRLSYKHPSIKAGVKWLFNHQEANGSWYGRWGVCYIYGTWAAVTGLLAAGIPASSPRIVKALNWLETTQQSDGGWGESCTSVKSKQFVPLPYSTLSQTSWALDTLILAGRKNHKSVEKGIKFLLRENHSSDALTYPTGIGLPGEFYIYYHSYNYIFPLLALAHYLKS